MKKRITAEEVFTCNGESIAIGPSTSGYVLSYSVDGQNWTDTDAVSPNEPCIVHGLVASMKFRLTGNTDNVDVIV